MPQSTVLCADSVHLRAAFAASGRTYGSRRLCTALHMSGVVMGRYRISSLMRANGLRPVWRRKFVHTTDSKHSLLVSPNVLARQSLDAGLQLVADRSSGAVQQAHGDAQALMREVTGHGPDKTLARGFAIVRTAEGKPVTTSRQADATTTLSIQFRDGFTDTRIDPN